MRETVSQTQTSKTVTQTGPYLPPLSARLSQFPSNEAYVPAEDAVNAEEEYKNDPEEEAEDEDEEDNEEDDEVEDDKVDDDDALGHPPSPPTRSYLPLVPRPHHPVDPTPHLATDPIPTDANEDHSSISSHADDAHVQDNLDNKAQQPLLDNLD